MNVYGASADSVGRYTRKGSRVGVDGRLEWREWETDDQQRRQAVSVVADRVQFLDGPGEGRAHGAPGEGDGGDDHAGDREVSRRRGGAESRSRSGARAWRSLDLRCSARIVRERRPCATCPVPAR